MAARCRRLRPPLLTGRAPRVLLACVGSQSGFSKNKLAAQALLVEQGGMKQ